MLQVPRKFNIIFWLTLHMDILHKNKKMEKSELIIFTYNFPFGDGETFFKNELVYLNESFSSIHIFPLFYGKSTLPREVPSNVSFSKPLLHFDIKKDRLKFLFFGIFNLSPFLFSLSEFYKKGVFKKKKWIVNFVGSTLITRILLKRNITKSINEKIHDTSVLYFYWGDKSSGIIPFIKKKKRNQIIARFHNSDLYEEIKGGYIPYREMLLRNIDYAIFISQKGRDYLLNRYPKIDFKSEVFRLGVKESKLSQFSSDNILRIVSCSYVVPIKRIHIILEALKLLNQEIIWTHFGDGILLNDLKLESKILGENITVKFPGHLSNQDVLNYYATNQVDLFINVSEYEGIPVSIMEAISFGIPVFATDVGGTAEIISENFGKLLPKNVSSVDLANCIEEFIGNREDEKMKMKLNAHQYWAENFNADINYKRFSEFLKGVH